MSVRHRVLDITTNETRGEGQLQVSQFTPGTNTRAIPAVTVTTTDQARVDTVTETKAPGETLRTETTRAIDLTTTSTTPQHAIVQTRASPDTTHQAKQAIHIGCRVKLRMRLTAPQIA